MSRVGDVVGVVARGLANLPAEVIVEEAEHRGTLVIELSVAPSDIGRIIGRQGRTAAALRLLASATAEREGKRATVDIRERADSTR